MNENEIGRIAAAANQLRPDWPVNSLRTLLNRDELRTRPRLDVAVALAWVASDPATKTPARILEQGPWWLASAAAGDPGDRRWRPPKDHQACGRHPGEHRDRCRLCAVDQIDAPTDPKPEVELDPDPDTREGRAAIRSITYASKADELRAVKAEATAGHCKHGIDPKLCADHRTQEVQ